MFHTVLIANRGAIACRIIRTLRALGVRSVAVYSDADAGSLHVSQADEAVRIGPPSAAESYLNIDAILAAARATGAQAIHPGYGFLSENVDFAEAAETAGIVFIGPTPDNLRAFGLKHRARALARDHGVPLAPGVDLLADVEAAAGAAAAIGYPVMLKATAGGGGIGMRVCEDEAGLRDAFGAVRRLAAGAFGDAGVFLERYVRAARHVEVQIFGDGAGRVVALGERDCSLQRRNQKVIEETPAPHLDPAMREKLIAAAVRLGRAVSYRSAGTVEFLYDPARAEAYFLEVNTRLQVEHGVTEQVAGVDLVEWMVRGAGGDYAFLDEWRGEPRGAAIQARLYAEDPRADFRPSSGRLSEVAFPAAARVETWIAPGDEVSAHYDPLLAKLIVTAADRAGAVAALQDALAATRLAGIETNLGWLREVAASEAFVSGQVSTDALGHIAHAPDTITVRSGGPATTVQDYPGRLGYWNVGVPPSGPMDTLSFRLGNRLLGNPEGAPGLEFAAAGPILCFNADALVCLTGADFGATLDDAPVAPWRPFSASAGQVLKIGRVEGPGLRGFLLLRGGLAAPAYLGSRSTFTLGGFGGPAGRALAAGDVLHLAREESGSPSRTLDERARPTLTRAWTLRVLPGPHGAPDFFTPADMAMLADTDWRVHYNSNRTGVRLIGPKPAWARRDGGEAGLHPSNIHDNAYAIGAVDFTGDMPIILGPDGPSLGGFVCPVVVIQADLWKTGQLAPGDTVRFAVVDDDGARAAETDQDAAIATLAPPPPRPAGAATTPGPILNEIRPAGERPRVVYRRQGDRHLLVEYGPIILDIELRLRVHALMLDLEALALPGVIDITPGIRSLQVHYDARILSRSRLLDALVEAETRLGGLDDIEIPSRVVHLPLSWNDPAIRLTIDKYMQSVRDDAPWCPDNIEFIRRINGLESAEDVRRIVFDARWLVMGLGDVYLGAPVATPLDPRHRLVTTKYNPARTWTPPNVVGIGGAYMCIYGMEGPGGYQLFGRTIQVWNTWRQTGAFTDGKPWLLRFFDQIRFFPVSHEELTAWRRDFPLGRRDIEIEPQTFRLKDHRAFLAAHRAEIDAFEARRSEAFRAERTAWERNGEFDRAEALAGVADVEASAGPVVAPAGSELVEAPLGGSLWKMRVSVGDAVEKGAEIAVIEAMKAEVGVHSPVAGKVTAVYARETEPVAPGAALIALGGDVTGFTRLSVAGIAADVADRRRSAVAVVADALERVAAYEAVQPAVWIERVAPGKALAAAREVDRRIAAGDSLPLAGVPFAVKDNIDVDGLPTTAACPAFAYRPFDTARVVQRLLDAGAVFIGKTNLDQFATGLVGTRSPYGICGGVYNRDYISGGSSAGSAVAVAAGLVAFALGTDTAGSGRVPAALNGLVGLKPTRGRWSARGVVPACRSLDCVSVFTSTALDAAHVDEVAAGFDEQDLYSRRGPAPAPPCVPDRFRLGVPRAGQLEWFGDLQSPRLFEMAVERLIAVGGEPVEVDLTPFLEAAELLYQGPWVAERTAAVEDLFRRKPLALHPVVRGILQGGLTWSAVDAFKAQYRLLAYQRDAERLWSDVDILLTPTCATTWRVREVLAEPLALNANLGRYTNFVNLLDMSAIAVPAGFRDNATGFGVTLVGPAWADRAVIDLARRYEETAPMPDAPPLDLAGVTPKVKLAVVGAHLGGMPLHWQLASRDAALVRRCRTAAAYRLYAMADSTPPKPALVHVGPGGGAIEVEVYELGVEAFGSFVVEVPPPLAIGTVTLDDGASVKGFVAEPRALDGAQDITALGGWRAYISSLT